MAGICVDILSRVLVMREVINGFRICINRFTGYSPGGATTRCNTSQLRAMTDIRPRLLCSVVFCLLSESESYVTTDGQSASLSWNKAPIWGLRPDFYYCQTIEGLLMWGALSDERTSLSFTIAAGPRQRSHSRVRVP
jgi:hypothetical protein